MKKYGGAFVLATIFFVVGLATLSDYGMNWDAPGHMLQGQAYAQFFLTGKTTYGFPTGDSPIFVNPNQWASRYYFSGWENPEGQQASIVPDLRIRAAHESILEKIGIRRSLYMNEHWNADAFFAFPDSGHPPHIDTIAALFNRVLYQSLGWVGDVESYQIFYLLVSALGVAIVAWFAYDLTGSTLAALIAGITLATYPSWVGEAHTNMKDPIQATFFAGAVWMFWRWVRGSINQGVTSAGGAPRRGPLVGFLGGKRSAGPQLALIMFFFLLFLALGVKWNIVVLPIILAIWLWAIRNTDTFKRWFVSKRLLVQLGLGGLAVSGALFATWPHAWGDPIGLLLAYFQFTKSTGIGVPIQQPGFIFLGFNTLPVRIVFAQMPEVVLLLLAIGVLVSLVRKKDPLHSGILLVAWLLVPIMRISWPGARNYGGMRQVMEVLPAVTVLAGVGVAFLIEKTHGYLQKVIVIITFISFVTLVYSLMLIHPNENTYFNRVTGGLSGAVRARLVDWTLTYGNVFRQGVNWVNVNAPEGANVALTAGNMLAINPLWLRPDIHFSPANFSGFAAKGEYVLMLFDTLDPPVFTSRYFARFLRPVHEIVVDGVPILSIYQNDPSYRRVDMSREQKARDVVVEKLVRAGRNFWRIDLKRHMWVTRVVVQTDGAPCQSGDFEVLRFIDADRIPSAVTQGQLFGINDRVAVDATHSEYDFAKEPARFIEIYPTSEQSCFANAQTVEVWYVE